MKINEDAAVVIAALPAMKPVHDKLKYLSAEVLYLDRHVSCDTHITMFVTFLLHFPLTKSLQKIVSNWKTFMKTFSRQYTNSARAIRPNDQIESVYDLLVKVSIHE